MDEDQQLGISFHSLPSHVNKQGKPAPGRCPVGEGRSHRTLLPGTMKAGLASFASGVQLRLKLDEATSNKDDPTPSECGHAGDLARTRAMISGEFLTVLRAPARSLPHGRGCGHGGQQRGQHQRGRGPHRPPAQPQVAHREAEGAGQGTCRELKARAPAAPPAKQRPAARQPAAALTCAPPRPARRAGAAPGAAHVHQREPGVPARHGAAVVSHSGADGLPLRGAWCCVALVTVQWAGWAGRAAGRVAKTGGGLDNCGLDDKGVGSLCERVGHPPAFGCLHSPVLPLACCTPPPAQHTPHTDLLIHLS